MRLIIVLLVVITLILLGLFAPMLYSVIVGIIAIAPTLFTVAGVFLAMLVGLLAYHAANGTL